MLTKGNIEFLFKNGMMNITAHTLDAAHAYKVVKFKSILKNVMNNIGEMEKSFSKELGIDDAFINRINDLLSKDEKDLTKKEKEELAGLREIDNKFGEMRKAMLQEEADLSEAKTMPYEEWKKLQDENKDQQLSYRDNLGQIINQRELLMVFEAELEGILWKAPEE